MHLAMVTETYPPDVNGVAMTLERLTRGLADHGHRVTVIRPRPPRSAEPDHPEADPESTAVQQVRVPGIPIPQYPRLRFGLPVYLRLRRLWKRDRPNVVHIATEGPLGLAALLAARAHRLPVTSSFHTNFDRYGEHYGYRWFADLLMGYFRRLHNRTACTLVPSLKTRDDLGGRGFKRVMILERGVDTELFGPHRRDAELRRQWGCPEGPATDHASPRPVVAYVGRVAEEKNVPLTIRAFQRFRNRLPEARMLIVGDGPSLPRLRRDHPDFIFAGMQRGQALARHYASADAFLFASTTETFGNVVSEAMASGLAVLTYDYAAGRRLIRDGHNGLLAPYDDEAEFLGRAELLAEMFEKRPAEAARLREAALAAVRPYGWDRVVARFEAILIRAARGESLEGIEPTPSTAPDAGGSSEHPGPRASRSTPA